MTWKTIVKMIITANLFFQAGEMFASPDGGVTFWFCFYIITGAFWLMLGFKDKKPNSLWL